MSFDKTDEIFLLHQKTFDLISNVDLVFLQGYPNGQVISVERIS